MKYQWVNKYAVVGIVILCFVSRLPQLLSANLLLDGDECILGLMAKHLAEGKPVPPFFYGQSYGFSWVEAQSVRMAYALTGPSDFSVKLAMLSLWTIGVCLLYFTFKNFSHARKPWLPLLCTLAFILSPMFAVWSMKARGGYITAFVLASLVTFLCTHTTLRQKRVVPFLIGAALIFIYQSQALWLAGLVPIVLYAVYKSKRWAFTVFALAGMLMSSLFFYFIKANLSDFWLPPALNLSTIDWSTAIHIPKHIFQSFTGSYIYYDFMKCGPATTWAAAIHLLAVVVVLVFVGMNLVRGSKVPPMLSVFALAVLLCVAYLFLIDHSSLRYILPLSLYSFLILFTCLIEFLPRKIAYLLLGIFIFIGSLSLYDFKNYILGDKTVLLQTIGNLQAEKVGHIFCDGGLLQWQFMYYSHEAIIARYHTLADRYPLYIEKVNYAFAHPTINTAVVGYYNEAVPAKFPTAINIKEQLYYITNPTYTVLTSLGFELPFTKSGL